jgi:peptidoglycan hydrolase FlgJ
MSTMIDTGSLYYQNRSLDLPKAAKAEGMAQAAHAKKPIDKTSDLYKQCQDFESIFVKQMLDAMRKSVDKSSLTEDAPGKDIYEDMLYDQYSTLMTKSAGFGLADQLYIELDGIQG